MRPTKSSFDLVKPIETVLPFLDERPMVNCVALMSLPEVRTFLGAAAPCGS
jgi:hypothetical protein